MSIADRTFARVETTLKGFLRTIPSGQARPLFSGEPVFSGGTLEGSGLAEPVVHFLRNMDAKLNAILGLLNHRLLEDDFPSRILVHDISGAGLRFSSADDFELGTSVEIVVALSAYPLRLAGTLGSIIRKDTDEGTTLWAMEFKDMRETEREKIIQFVIAEQREQLRDRRANND